MRHHFLNKLDRRKYCYLFLDFEGTIAPLRDRTHLTKPRQQIIKALSNLEAIPKVSINIISEIDPEQTRSLIEIPGFNYIGYLGGEILMDGHITNLIKPNSFSKIFGAIEKKFYSVFKDVPGIQFVKTPYYIMIDHGTNYSPSFYHALNLWMEEIFPKIVRHRLIPNILHDRKVILRPAKLNKLNAINHIFNEKELHKSLIIYVGDNFMDEHVFSNLKDKGITIRVNNYSINSSAHHSFGSDIELVQFLNMIYKFYS